MPKRTTRRRLHLNGPDVTPLASVFLALSCLLLLIYQPAEPELGLVTLHETPRLACQPCFSVPAHTGIFLYLTADGRTSFAVDNSSLQAAIIERIDQKNGASTATSQPLSQRALTEAQLLACITLARTLSRSAPNPYDYLYLVIDANVSSSAVMHLVGLLQRHHINRLHLVTHCYT